MDKEEGGKGPTRGIRPGKNRRIHRRLGTENRCYRYLITCCVYVRDVTVAIMNSNEEIFRLINFTNGTQK